MVWDTAHETCKSCNFSGYGIVLKSLLILICHRKMQICCGKQFQMLSWVKPSGKTFDN